MGLIKLIFFPVTIIFRIFSALIQLLVGVASLCLVGFLILWLIIIPFYKSQETSDQPTEKKITKVVKKSATTKQHHRARVSQ